tara:strand:- start:388 stop:831 length:444 start_codon:yes stop_codon:yes gene_type:complete
MNLYEHCPNIPDLPDNLIKLITEENARQSNSLFVANNGERYKIPWYSLHTIVFPEVIEFLQPYFDPKLNIKIQLITRELLIHKDQGRTSCYNYLVKTGGNVSTVWFDDDKNEIERVILPERSWYKLNVSVFHNVYDITSTRIAITVS